MKNVKQKIKYNAPDTRSRNLHKKLVQEISASFLGQILMYVHASSYII